MPYGPGHQMSKSVKSNLSYRKKDRRLFNKGFKKTDNRQQVHFEKKLSKEELQEFSKKFKKEQRGYERKVLVATLVISILIFAILAYLMNT